MTIRKALLITTLAFAIAYVGGWAYRCLQDTKLIEAEYTGITGGGFTLQSTVGEVSLHHFKGRVVLIYFGYTSCPDVCPSSLAVMAEAIKQMDGVHSVKGLLISIDPERDTLDKLKDYASKFHPEITGIGADKHRTLEVATRYGVYYQKVSQQTMQQGAMDHTKMDHDGMNNYHVDHASRLYIIDQQGHLAGVLKQGASPQQIVDRITRLL